MSVLETITLPRTRSIPWVLAASVLLASLAMRLGLLSAPPEFDELYHVLAAQGWLETGGFAILDGVYTRGAGFTWLVALVFEATGSTALEAARLVSVISGSLIPLFLFLWLRGPLGVATALLVAGFAILWPQGVLEAQMARFYAVHVASFTLGAIAFYQLLTGARLRIFWALLAVVAWGFAVHVQITSVIGIAGALAWGYGLLLWRLERNLPQKAIILGATIGLGLLTVAIAYVTGLLDKAWALYRWTPGHAEPLRDYVGFYHAILRQMYPTLWFATPLLAVIALIVRPVLAAYCLAIFATGFLIHSFGGMKAVRYLSFAMPFLFAIWAIALWQVASWVMARLSAARAVPVERRQVVALALVFGLAMVSNVFALRTATLAMGQGLPSRGDWSGAPGVVGNWIDAPFVATTRELHMLHSLGAYDVLISDSRVSELVPPEEFGVDIRTGRPVIASEGAIDAMLACQPSGLLVTSPHWWDAKGWGPRILSLMASRGIEPETRTEGALLAVRWETTAAPACDAFPLPRTG